jgi:hypothetical protein
MAARAKERGVVINPATNSVHASDLFISGPSTKKRRSDADRMGRKIRLGSLAVNAWRMPGSVRSDEW